MANFNGKNVNVVILNRSSADINMGNYIDQVDGLLKLSREEHKKFSSRYNFTHDKFQYETIREIMYSMQYVFALVVDESVVGFSIYNKGELKDFYIDPNKNNEGYGTLLINTIFEFLKRKGQKNVIIELWSNNQRTINFFSKSKFQVAYLGMVRKL